MIRQKALSVKLDVDIFDELEKELQSSWKTRNRIINEAVKMYLCAQNTRRRARAHGVGNPLADKAVAEFLKKWILAEANYYIGQITT